MDVQKPAPISAMRSTAPGTVFVRPLLLKPQWMNGLSERLLVSHYENNYGGALRRLNAIRGRLADHDWAHFRSGSTSERDVDADWSGDHDQQPLYDRLRQGVALRFPSCLLAALTTGLLADSMGDQR